MRTLIGLGAVLLAGCADTADTFPLNDAARKIGRPKVEFVRTGIGRGPITITMPDGEVLTGTWRVAFDGAVGMGFEVAVVRPRQLLSAMAMFSSWRLGRRRRFFAEEKAVPSVTAQGNVRPMKGPYGR
jgi:hypothetical protein